MESQVRTSPQPSDIKLEDLMIGDVFHSKTGIINFRTLVHTPTHSKVNYQLFLIDGVLQYQDDYTTRKFRKETQAYTVWLNNIIMAE